MIMSNNKTGKQLRMIVQWYANKIYYDMCDATEEIEWLIDNINDEAFQQIVEFYDDYHKTK